MGLKFRRGTTAQKSGSLAFGEPYVNTTLGTLQVGGPDGDITLGSSGTGSTGNFGAISGSGLDITGNANIAGNLTLGGQLTIGDNTSDTVNVVASLSSSLIPSITNAFDLGSANYFWRDLYISTGSIKFVGAPGVVVGTLTNTGNGLNLDGGIVANGNSSFGTSSLSSTSVTGSLGVTGYTTLNGYVRIMESLSVDNDITASNLSIVNGLKIGGSTINTVIKNTLNTESIISGSSQLTSSYDSRFSEIYDLSIVTVTKTFNNIVVNGTGSFARIESVTSQATIIGNSFVVVNTATPTSRYAGISVYDSGSTLSTASFYYDGQTNDWGYEYSSSTGVDYAVAIFGPEYSTKGIPTYLKTNRIPKSVDNHHLNDSNIFDDGTTISLGTNSVVTGSLTVSSAVNAASVMVNGYLEIKTGTDVNSVKIGRNTGGSATRTVAIGYGSAGGAGSYNVAVGDQAGQSLAGSNNVVIGATTLNTTTNASSNTVVGSNSGNTVALGNTNTLIGAGISIGVGSATNTIIGAAVSQSAITDNIILANGSGVVKFRFDGTNNILHGNSVVSGSLNVTGDVVAYSTSDRRHKNNIVLISDALSKVTKLNGVTWEWNDDVDDTTKSTPKTGLIAQEVQEVLPEVVKERGDGFLALDYSKMMGLMVEAMKEQQTQIHSLTLEIEKLKEQKGL